MKMYNIEIEFFVNFLMGLELPAKQSRMRIRLCRLATDKIKQIEEEKMDLIKKYGNLDEDGEVKKIRNEKSQLIWDIENRPAFDQDYKELMTEEWVLDNTEERKEMFLTIKDVVLNVDKTFKGKEALDYDRWCEIVEEINY